MKRTGTLLMLLVSAGMSACASVMPANAPDYARAEAPPAGQAHLYIYRNGAFPAKRTPRITVDGKRVFDPPEGAYTMLTLPPGQHVAEMTWTFDLKQPKRATPVTLGDRGVHYLKITGDFDYEPPSFQQEVVMSMTAGVFSFPHTFSWLVEMPQDAAEREMRDCCRYVAPEK